MAYLHGRHIDFAPPHTRLRWDRIGVLAALIVFWIAVAALIVR